MLELKKLVFGVQKSSIKIHSHSKVAEPWIFKCEYRIWELRKKKINLVGHDLKNFIGKTVEFYLRHFDIISLDLNPDVNQSIILYSI